MKKWQCCCGPILAFGFKVCTVELYWYFSSPRSRIFSCCFHWNHLFALIVIMWKELYNTQFRAALSNPVLSGSGDTREGYVMRNFWNLFSGYRANPSSQSWPPPWKCFKHVFFPKKIHGHTTFLPWQSIYENYSNNWLCFAIQLADFVFIYIYNTYFLIYNSVNGSRGCSLPLCPLVGETWNTLHPLLLVMGAKSYMQTSTVWPNSLHP